MLGVFGHSDLVLQPPWVSLLLWQPPTSLPTNFLQWRWENSSVVHFIPSKSTDMGGAAMQLQHSYVQVLYTQHIIFYCYFSFVSTEVCPSSCMAAYRSNQEKSRPLAKHSGTCAALKAGIWTNRNHSTLPPIICYITR